MCRVRFPTFSSEVRCELCAHMQSLLAALRVLVLLIEGGSCSDSTDAEFAFRVVCFVFFVYEPRFPTPGVVGFFPLKIG